MEENCWRGAGTGDTGGRCSDLGLYVADSKDDVRNLEIAMGRVVVLADHTERYLQYCADEKQHKLKTLQSKRVYVEDFANSFRTLGDAT